MYAINKFQFENMDIFEGYVKLENRWCQDRPNNKEAVYNTFKDAKDACSQEKTCNQFYDVQSRNQTFVICGSSDIKKRSYIENSTVYMKCKS